MLRIGSVILREVVRCLWNARGLTSDYWRPPGPPSIPHGAAAAAPPEDTCCSQLLQAAAAVAAAATGVTAPITSTNRLFPIEGFSKSNFWIYLRTLVASGQLLQITIVALHHFTIPNKENFRPYCKIGRPFWP